MIRRGCIKVDIFTFKSLNFSKIFSKNFNFIFKRFSTTKKFGDKRKITTINKDNVIYSPTLDGYNPKVIREVTFEDGTETNLEYRTLAWQPFRKWMREQEFNPQPGEKYDKIVS